MIKIRRGWEKPESAVTPEQFFWNRRQLMKGLAAGPILAGAASVFGAAAVEFGCVACKQSSRT